MNFCSHCGEPVQIRVPDGDNRPRFVCGDCGTIHYQNPKIVVGCIPEWEDRVLLCRRAIEPRYGLWTLPAGFMENGETSQQGAARETYEEAKARVEVKDLYTLFNLPHINQVYMLFRGTLREAAYGPSAESLEVELFRAATIPWERIAFPVVRETLRLYFQDRTDNAFRLHVGDIVRNAEEPRRYRITMLEQPTD